MTDERSHLLDQLRIERGDANRSRSGRGWIGWTIGVVVLLALATYGWIAFAARGQIPVRLATATAAGAAASDTASARGSILDASGYVVARRQATVSAKITGRVVEVLIEEGQMVAIDEVVARLDDANARAALAQAEAQVAQATASLEATRVALTNAVPIFERNREQFSRKVTSAQEFDTAKASYDVARSAHSVAEQALGVSVAVRAVAQRNLADTVVRAPFAGVVTVKAAQEGEMVSPNSAGGGFTRTGIGTIVDMDSLEIEVDVSENFINRVKPEQSVSIKLNAYPDWNIPGHVIAIVPTADRAKATVRVRIAFDERDARVLPEMGLRVAFLSEPSAAGASGNAAGSAPVSGGVIVASDAIQVSGDTGVVFVVRNDKVERRVVRVGGSTPAGRIVLSGITAGTKLAIGDPTVLADGARVRVVE